LSSDPSVTPKEAFRVAYSVALVANFITGLISTILAMFGPLILRYVPPAALLVPIAGIGIAFLGLEQLTNSIAAPIVGYYATMWLFMGWYSGVRIGYGSFRLPEALQVILVGVILGWATGLNATQDVTNAAKLVKWWGPVFAAKELFSEFSIIKDYLGIVIPIALSATATTLMCLVSAKAAGDPYPVRETMMSDGIGTMLSSLFGSPFGTVIYIGHPAHKRSGALVGYSVVNGMCYLIMGWFGILALIQSLVNQATIGPIVLFVGFMCNEDAINFMPPRHYAAYIIGVFPSYVKIVQIKEKGISLISPSFEFRFL
jgi:adenine/guanine/hypoxanthine permease